MTSPADLGWKNQRPATAGVRYHTKKRTKLEHKTTNENPMVLMMLMMMVMVMVTVMVMVMVMMMMMMMILMIAMIVVMMAMMKMAIKVFPAPSVVLSHNYYSQRKPHQSIRYRGGRHRPLLTAESPPRSPLSHLIIKSAMLFPNEAPWRSMGGIVRNRGERHPSHMGNAANGISQPAIAGKNGWPCLLITAEKPTHQAKYKMPNPWHLS